MSIKKTYAMPSLQIVMLSQSDLIATSGSGDHYPVSLRFYVDESEEEGVAD